MDQLISQVVLSSQGAQALARSLPDFGGIGAEEARAVHNLAIHYGVVLAEMVALDTVAPGATVGRSAEHGEIVFLRVAVLAAILLHDLEHFLQAHDRHRLDVPRLAQAGRKQCAGELPLIGSHLAQWQALALLRDEVPIHTLICIKRESRFAALIGIEPGKKALSTLGHERRRMYAVRMDMIGMALARAEQTHSHERCGGTEKRSALHAHEFPPGSLFCQPSTEMRAGAGC